MNLTASQISAIKYYIGDVQGDDPFWSDGKAYLVLNSLFYPDISTEQARTKEGKKLNPVILKEPERLLYVLSNLLSACEYGRSAPVQTAYRVERYSDYLLNAKEGKTISFTSTSTAGFLNAYRDRKGVALMKFHISEGTPCIPVENALDSYAKPDEQEILLPPWLSLHLTECELSPNEQKITDSDGKPPLISVDVEITGVLPFPSPVQIPESGNLAGMRVLSALNQGIEPSQDDISTYCAWKRAIITNLLR
jgi:hypothetical protein